MELRCNRLPGHSRCLDKIKKAKCPAMEVCCSGQRSNEKAEPEPVRKASGGTLKVLVVPYPKAA